MKFAMVLCLFCVAPAWTARPFVTGDARLTTAGSCQVEDWSRSDEHSREVWALIAESCGDDQAKPCWQTGLRHSIFPELLQVDTTAGAQHDEGRGRRWLSFGLRWTSARLFSQP